MGANKEYFAVFNKAVSETVLVGEVFHTNTEEFARITKEAVSKGINFIIVYIAWVMAEAKENITRGNLNMTALLVVVFKGGVHDEVFKGDAFWLSIEGDAGVQFDVFKESGGVALNLLLSNSDVADNDVGKADLTFRQEEGESEEGEDDHANCAGDD